MLPWEEGRGLSLTGKPEKPICAMESEAAGVPAASLLLFITYLFVNGCLPGYSRQILPERAASAFLAIWYPVLTPTVWSSRTGLRASLTAFCFPHIFSPPLRSNITTHFNSIFYPKQHIFLSLCCSDRQLDPTHSTVKPQHGARWFLISHLPIQLYLHLLLPPVLSERGEGRHVYQPWRWCPSS